MQNRRQLLRSAGACLLAGSVGPCVSAGAAPAALTIHMDDEGPLKHLPLSVARQMGFFRAEGVTVELVGASSPSAEAAEVLCTTFGRAVLPSPQARPLTAIAMLGRGPQVVLGVPAVGPAAVVTTVAQLRGAVVGVQGGVARRMAELMLWRAGIRAQEVQFVELADNAQAMEAFLSGRLDALSAQDPLVTVLERRGEIRVLSDTRTLKGTEQVFSGEVPCTCLMVATEWMRSQPVLCQSLCNGVVRALKWLQTAGPSDLVRVLPEASWPGDRAALLEAFNKSRETISSDGWIPPDGPETLRHAVAHLTKGGGWGGLDLSSAWTNRFVERAKALNRL